MPRPRKINTDDAAVKAAVETAMTPEPTPVKAEVEANPLLGLFERATEEQKDAMRKALGVQASVKAPKRKQSNSDAQQVLAARGGGTFQPEGFRPVPPEGVAQNGSDAVRRWTARWENGQTFSSRQAEIEGMDAEALAATAIE